MKLWPASLLWRSVLLIALLLAIAHFAWLQIFRVSEREPRARQVAQQIVSVVNLTRAALITAQPSKRLALLEELSAEEGIQVYSGHPGERIVPLADLPFLKLERARSNDCSAPAPSSLPAATASVARGSAFSSTTTNTGCSCRARGWNASTPCAGSAGERWSWRWRCSAPI